MGRDDVVPGMIAAIQTHGELLHWHPHLHALVTCGAFTPAGEFLELPELDLERLEAAWQEAVFALYLAEDKIEPEVVENMRSWQHSGFSVDQSVFLPAGDRAGIERLVQYMTRCPFSLSRLVKVSESGQVVYKAEKQACRAFPDPGRDGMQPGTKRNYQILSPLDFLAEFTQHIPAKGAHLIRYYGWYSNKSRGMRKKAAEAARRVSRPVAAESRALRPKPLQPDLGHAHQAGVRDRPVGLPSLWRPDEGDCLHRAAAGRRDREDPAATVGGCGSPRHRGRHPTSMVWSTNWIPTVRTRRRN